MIKKQVKRDDKKQESKAKIPTGTVVYIGNLNYKRGELGIRKLFEKYGIVTKITVIEDKESGKKKGIAFVEMVKKENAMEAVKNLNGKIVDGRTLKVSIAKNRFRPEESIVAKKEVVKKVETKKIVTKKTAKKGLVKQGLDVLFKYLKSK